MPFIKVTISNNTHRLEFFPIKIAQLHNFIRVKHQSQWRSKKWEEWLTVYKTHSLTLFHFNLPRTQWDRSFTNGKTEDQSQVTCQELDGKWTQFHVSKLYWLHSCTNAKNKRALRLQHRSYPDDYRQGIDAL